MNAPTLRAEGLSKHFGGVRAVKNVSLDLSFGQVHAVIGTNGAGKSTLVNLLCGELVPDSGHVLLAGTNLAGMPPERLSMLGIGRSHQRTSVFTSFSVFENVRLAAQSRRRRNWQFWRNADDHADVNAFADSVLESVGLHGMRSVKAAALSHGAQRQLEIALCLATRPTVLLLDEPLAGMGAAESADILALVERLKPDHAILLIEHDMDAVFAIADWLTVMVDGGVIASGLPAELRLNAAVQEAYLGTGVADNHWHSGHG